MKLNIKTPKTIKVRDNMFHFSSKHERKHDVEKTARKLELTGFNVRIKRQNPYLLYKRKRRGNLRCKKSK